MANFLRIFFLFSLAIGAIDAGWADKMADGETSGGKSRIENQSVQDPQKLEGVSPIIQPFKETFDKCTAQANMGTDCKFENAGILGDEAHRRRRSCHNVGEAIDVGFIECAGQKIKTETPHYLDFVKCMADGPKVDAGKPHKLEAIFYKTGGSPHVKQKSDHVKHVHIQLKNCRMVRGPQG